MAATAATAATAIYKYTYTLGRSLYVPLTSRCNSVPLPQTRGPGFLLPLPAAEALARVRNAELPPGPSVLPTTDLYEDWLEEHDRVGLPEYDLPLVSGLYRFGDGGDLSESLQRRREIQAAMNASSGGDGGGDAEIDDLLQPSISSLVDEVSSRLDFDPNFKEVVIAGEGEPTLRMDALLAVARRVRSFRESDAKYSATRRRSAGRHLPSYLPVRVITNGLVYGVPNLGYSPQNLERDGMTVVPPHRHVVLRDMLDAGISRVSVALNTANRHEYDVIMEPSCHTGGGAMVGSGEGRTEDTGNGGGGESATTLMPGTAHDIVCEFVLEAGKLGMEVELTGIDRPGIDKRETDRLARLLLSVGRKTRRERAIRWRQYFY